MKKLENKTVLITGSLLRTGRACAVAAAREGANVIVADKRSDETDEAMEQIKKENCNAVFVECDVTNFRQVQTVIETATALFSTIDIVLNNVWSEEESKKRDVKSREFWFKKNYPDPDGIHDCLKPHLEQMSKQRKGVIVNMFAGLDKSGFATSPHTVRAKYGITGLTNTSALEYAAEGIRINAIGPAVYNTFKRARPRTDYTNVAPQDSEPGKPEDLANLFIFLASDQSSFVFGTTLEVGGFR